MADGTTVDADTSSDADVAAALGLEATEEQKQDDGDVEGSEDQESNESDEVAQLRRELATLRRENAERRIKEREARQAATKDDGDESKEIKAARDAGREEARAEHGVELTEARIRAALTGVVPDDNLDEFVQDLNISRYVGDDHKPDLDAITALKERQAKLLGSGKRTTKVSNGRQGGGTTAKSNADQFGEIVTGLLGN